MAVGLLAKALTSRAASKIGDDEDDETTVTLPGGERIRARRGGGGPAPQTTGQPTSAGAPDVPADLDMDALRAMAQARAQDATSPAQALAERDRLDPGSVAQQGDLVPETPGTETPIGERREPPPQMVNPFDKARGAIDQANPLNQARQQVDAVNPMNQVRGQIAEVNPFTQMRQRLDQGVGGLLGQRLARLRQSGLSQEEAIAQAADEGSIDPRLARRMLGIFNQ